MTSRSSSPGIIVSITRPITPEPYMDVVARLGWGNLTEHPLEYQFVGGGMRRPLSSTPSPWGGRSPTWSPSNNWGSPTFPLRPLPWDRPDATTWGPDPWSGQPLFPEDLDRSPSPETWQDQVARRAITEGNGWGRDAGYLHIRDGQ